MIHKVKFDDYPKQDFIDEINRIKTPSDRRSYFSDVENIPQIHSLPAFDWLNKKVKEEALKYFETIRGHDYNSTVVDIYAQKSWIVELQPGGQVDWHWHKNAHLSCVFYIDVPPGSCALEFGDMDWQRGLPFAVKEYMYKSAYAHFYQQDNKMHEVENGMMMVFPSLMIHGTRMSNHTEGTRLAVSYDLMVTSRLPQENLTLDPKFWKLLD
tara:strand:+ start:244 stop:876 length:633 start_codon:yes stop_codon:yes gene_type:complete